MRADLAISRWRRDNTLNAVVRAALLGGVFVYAMLIMGMQLGGAAMILGVGFLWVILMALNYRSMKTSRIAAASPSLIAAGLYDRAEEHIDQVLSAFTMFRGVKLMTLHHLAVLRHAQRQWAEVVMLCQAILSQRMAALMGLSSRCRLIMAEALLEMNDLPSAHQALAGMYSERIGLSDALQLTAVQIDYLARVGDWKAMVENIAHKVQLAELLPTPAAARTQALLALAAIQTGKSDWEAYLRRRAEILMDTDELIAQRPALKKLWTTPAAT